MKSERVAHLRASLCLPRTSFPMRARLPSLERKLLEKWQAMQLYPSLLEQRAEGPSFVLHDGPPYASGSLQWSHILNKILKDFVLRSRSMKGERCEFVPGWDCHGLPIEWEVAIQAGPASSAEDKLLMRRACRAYAEKSIAQQREQFKRLGILGHWDDAFVTMSPSYQASITRALATLVRSESLVQRTRPVFWCASCETALAEFEVSYLPRESSEAYFTFPLISDPIHLDKTLRGRNVEVVAWTPNLWMIPGVMGLGVQPSATYVAVRLQRKVCLVAEDCLPSLTEAFQLGAKPDVLLRLPGSALVSLKCRHPLVHRSLSILEASKLRMQQGTGVVPISPGHEPEYYELSAEHQLDMFSPVDEKGCFTQEVESLAGQSIWSVEQRLLHQLESMDSLLSSPDARVEKNYPHCWKCKHPVAFRATPQWFVPMDSHDLRKKALSALEQIKWLPEWGHKRMAALLQRRSDWCLSRQRVWGVPLPIFYCMRCSDPVLDADHIEHLADRFEASPYGADLWFETPVEELLPRTEEELRCERCGNHTFRKEEDTVDVWFDSGVAAWVLSEREGEAPLADMVLEGVDQFQGWFQGSLLSSLQLGVDLESRAQLDSYIFAAYEPEKVEMETFQLPFQEVLAHGRIVGEVSLLAAEQESLQSAQKDSIGAAPATPLPVAVLGEDSPEQTMQRWGAELLRLWVASEDFQKHREMGFQDYKLLSHMYRKVRNTFRFMLANLYDFDESQDVIEWGLMEDVDRNALHLLHVHVKEIRKHYENYEFHKVWRHIYSYCGRDLSGFYFEVIKDRLYSSAPDWYVRRSAQSALFYISRILCRCLAPLLCFTAEEIWQHLPGEKAASVHFTMLPEADEIPTSHDQAEIWRGLKKTRRKVLRAFSSLQKGLRLKRPREASVCLYPNTEELREALELCDETILPYVLGVSQAEVAAKEKSPSREAWRSNWGSLAVEVRRAEGRRCQRCHYFYKELQNAGSHATCSRCRRALEQRQSKDSEGASSSGTGAGG